MNTEKINDGGPAFPLQDWDDCIHARRSETGMTLRDWFAGMALQGVMSTASGLGSMTKEERGEHLGEVAEILYDMADAMLASRSSTK